ncbi:DUF2956 domain-containing protein [uncultured Paraglaciecola sp.]|uniref:DUF2956 domain-containing protein n=1 Tax=uncultured Paraglaciecola sp. TaxID=1765024 RepID=UPI002596E910|nr:DUF2956 domain-containing protein [uncultured Paraglaciecola sp.]
MKNKVSPELEAQAMKIAKSRQKQGQTKEQTKLIAQGIEKGIAEYKKQQSKRMREIDKRKKQQTKKEYSQTPASEEGITEKHGASTTPWILLGLSWLGFISFIMFS